MNAASFSKFDWVNCIADRTPTRTNIDCLFYRALTRFRQLKNCRIHLAQGSKEEHNEEINIDAEKET